MNHFDSQRCNLSQMFESKTQVSDSTYNWASKPTPKAAFAGKKTAAVFNKKHRYIWPGSTKNGGFLRMIRVFCVQLIMLA